MNAPDKPLLIWDGECGFCRRWIERARRATGERVAYAPFQEAGASFPEIPESDFRRAIHFIEPDGRWSRGAEAVFRSLAYAPGRGWPLALYRRLPGFAPASEAVYRFVARRRPLFTKATRWIWGPHVVPPGETLTAWIFLRLLAAIYLVAFVSLGTQIAGLAGEGGILPARAYLDAVGARYGALAHWILPTLGWISAGDRFLHLLCGAGAALSVALALGAAPIACLVSLWLLYLSLSILGQDFFWFQWDSLLLETGFLAIFLAPWRRWSRPDTDPPPSRAGLWLSRWLLFRVMVSSAAVKLLSGDPAWRDLSALGYHFETQPLPTWTAWLAHQLPGGTLRLAAGATLGIEGVVPLLIFAPRRIRFAAAALLASLQIGILLTGNYGFFNLLTLALCVLLLDDGVWPWTWRRGRVDRAPAERGGRWLGVVVKPAALVLAALSLIPFLRTLRASTRWMFPVEVLYGAVWPFRSVNAYGLFAVMTKRRPEIQVEGSADGLVWIPYVFRYKPGDPRKRPEFVEPHQPRLDWQMWFAALSEHRRQPWFLSFCQRLLEGSPPVLGLLERNPFPRAPPRFLRAVLYEYRFSDPATRRATGAWWVRRHVGLYTPVLTLEGGQLVALPTIVP